jgi:NAD(P)-dependent dehydrogenase (short-subunit alcohol dehydrogenase family)
LSRRNGHTVQAKRSVVVTGAGGGIGGAAVRLLLERDDVCVTAVDRNEESLRGLQIEVGGRDGFTAVAADVSDAHDVQRVISDAAQRWGGIDGLFNVAGITHRPVDILELTDEEYDNVMAVNARSVWLGMKYALPYLLASDNAAIVNTGSTYAIRGDGAFVAYAASKHAVVGMTKAVALGYAKRGIRVNALLPGATDTDMIRTAFDGLAPDDRAEGERKFLEMTPSGRLGHPDEVASVGLWALLDAPAYFSGQVLPVDGAVTAR